MAVVHVFILFYVALGLLHQGLGLLSDYKVCGDPECASMMSRVQAQRDHIAQDCRFLNFRKGDMITVYYKLAGKRSDLWAGSIDKLFGLFQKDAVKVDESFIDEKKEIQVPTQEYDFFCFDENGSVIESNIEFGDLKDETQDAEIPKANDEFINTENSDPAQISVQDVTEQNNPASTEQGGSSWINSAVSGLFGRDEQSNHMNEPQDEGSDQVSFNSRKIAMNIEEDHVDEKTNPGTLSWIGGKLTNGFGFKDTKLDTNIEDPKEDKKPSFEQSRSWLSRGINVLGFGKDNTPDANKPETDTIDENKDVEDQSISNPDQPSDLDENIHNDENNPENSDHSKEIKVGTMEKEQTGWYGTIYNGIADIYNKERSESDEDDKDEESPDLAPNKDSESSSQSIFSVNGLSSVLDNVKFPFKSEKSDVEGDNEPTTIEEDTGKKELDEQQNSTIIDADVISETQTETDETLTLKDSAVSDVIVKVDDSSQESSNQNDEAPESTASKIPEIKPAGNVIQSENNADILDKERHQSEQTQTEEKVDSGKKDFYEQNITLMGLNHETQERPHEDIKITLITLKDTDDREINDDGDSSQEFNIQHDDTQESEDLKVSEIKSDDHLTEDVIPSEKTNSNGDVLEELNQSLSDQENASDTLKQNENNTSISTNPDPDDIHTSEPPVLQTGNELDDNEKQQSDADSNSETITTIQSKTSESETNVDILAEHNDDQILADKDTDTNLKKDSLGIRDVTEVNEMPSIVDNLAEHNDDQIAADKDTGTKIKEDSLGIRDVTEVNEMSSNDASEDIMKNEEMLETATVSIENKCMISPDEDENGYSLVHNTTKTDALDETSEENIHSDLSDLSIVDQKTENTSGPQDGLFEGDKTDVSISDAISTVESQTNSEVGRSDEVMEEQKEPSTHLETKELNTNVSSKTESELDTFMQNDTQMQNEQEASLKCGLDEENPHGDSNTVDHLKNKANTEDPDDHISSSETKLTINVFAENDPKSIQSTGQKENTAIETDNKDHHTIVESAIQDQAHDDMTESKGGEELPERSHALDKDTLVSFAEIKLAQNPSKAFPNLYSHLSEQNIKDLLDIVGDPKLSWLDSRMGNASNPDADDLAELNDIEQLLEYHIKTKNIPKNDGFPDQDNTYEYPALQKLSILLYTLREKYTSGETKVKVGLDESPGINQEECSHGACLNENTLIVNQETENNQITEDRSHINDFSHLTEAPVSEEKNLSKKTNDEDQTVEDLKTINEETRKHEDWTKVETKKTNSQLNHGIDSEAHIKPKELIQNGAEQFYQLAVFVGEVTINELSSLVRKVVSSLPDDIRPGPDLYGLPWEAVVFTGFFGLCTLLLFSCRFIHSIKSRLYASKEKQMAQKVAELLDEKCKVLETFSEVKQKYEKLESTLQNSGIYARSGEKGDLEVASQKLEQSNGQMKKEIERLEEELSQQNKARKQQEDQLAELEQILRNLEEEAKERKSQLEQDNTTLKIYAINTERLQKNLQAAKEEQAMLLESKGQLVQEAEGWTERLVELEEEMKLCESSHAGMMDDCANKDERIKSLTECLLKMRDWDSEDETSSNNTAATENGDSSDFHQKQKVQKLIEAAKISADLKSMEEEKNRVFAKLTDEIKAKEDLQEGITELEENKEVLKSESAKFSSESQKLQQKLQIMTEMYQENELKLHRMLTVEEKERLHKEEKLNKADKKINLAAEELITYRQRAKDLEDELERTSQAYKNQIASQEKKAHDNWLAARAADRDLTDVKRENSSLRQRLTDSQFKLEILEKDPYVREGRPIFRGERSPYGPSPHGRPSSETRPFLSPPTLMDGPPRLSPQFGRGHQLPDPGLPFRRPPPGPYAMGPLPPRPPIHPEPYFGDKSDSSFLRNSSGVSENENREGPQSMPGDMRMPPDPDSRMGPLPGPPLMGMPPLIDPRDRFPLRGPYGPPEFFAPRGPGGLPMNMRGPLPPGVFPRGPMPLPQHMGYLPPRPLSDNFPPGPPPRPSPPGSEQPPEQSHSPHNAI
ncbi:cTAGE family member 5 isoform X2 [Paramisgurnus dabryanus]|uniref:cTAGE family member 5 isoform X2 n=1 Tax=Paramisgurnus dabryanus TaxID=90735 RepID=UPI0031F34650